MDNKVLYAFSDFETCFDVNELKLISEENIKNNGVIKRDRYLNVESRVYLCGWTIGNTQQEVLDNFHQSEDINEFLNFITSFLEDNGSNDDYKIMRLYFHNMNYDMAFMIHHLLSQRFLSTCSVSVIGKEDKLYSFSLTDDETGKKVEILDSYNIIRVRLAKFKQFGSIRKREDLLEKSMDIIRDIDHVADESEKEYHRHDVLTMAFNVLEYFSDKTFHITSSSFAFKEFRKHLRQKDLEKYFNFTIEGYIPEYNLQRLQNYNFTSLIHKEQPHIFIYEVLERMYKGGQTFNNPRYMYQLLDNVKVIDANSLYPFSLISCKIPYISNLDSKIKRKYFYSKKREVFKANSIDEINDYISNREEIDVPIIERDYMLMYTFKCHIKLKKGIGFSPVTRGFCEEVINMISYIDDNSRAIKEAEVIFSGTEYDIKNWLLYYDIKDFELVNYFIFDIIKGKDLKLFQSIINEWAELKEKYSSKEHYNDLLKGRYKLFLNSLTGKFGEKIRGKKTMVNRKGEFEYVDSEIVNGRCITVILSLISFSRLYMSKNILKNPDRYVYTDTDSIALLDVSDEYINENFEIDDKKLGCFKIEKVFKQAVYVKPKCYVGLDENNKIVPTVAGCKINSDFIKSKDNLDWIFIKKQHIGKKVIKVKCKNGVLLIDKPYVIKEDQGTNRLFSTEYEVFLRNYYHIYHHRIYSDYDIMSLIDNDELENYNLSVQDSEVRI